MVAVVRPARLEATETSPPLDKDHAANDGVVKTPPWNRSASRA